MRAARRVAIVHHHVRPGGVTSVMARSLAALRDHDVRVAVLSGEPPGPEFPGPVCVVPGLAYGAEGDPAALADRLLEAARGALGGDPDLLHVHNHALGKNTLLPRSLRVWAERGGRLLLQVHDFAEDGRPGNYQRLLEDLGAGQAARMSGLLYPAGPQVHYVALNLRDLTLLKAAGLPDACAHYLPNCADLPGAAAQPARGAPLFVYPTRAIRRKNIGEFLLWSAVGEPGERWALSLAPRSAVDRIPYEAWVKFAGEQKLPVEFEAGARRGWTLADLLREATALVTTSVGEGFGLAYLEPWLAGRPIYGRNLPEITMGLVESGLELAHLYAALQVPVDWIGREKLRAAIGKGLHDVYGAYGRTVPPGALEQACHGFDTQSEVDFGRLNEDLQRDVILRVRADRAARAQLRPPGLAVPALAASVLLRNQSIVRERYGVAAYGRRLLDLYGRVAESVPGTLQSLSSDALLDGFLDPARFTLLRT